MHHFEYRDGEMYCEDVRLAEIAQRFGTPCYVYSAATLTRHFEAFDTPFSDLHHLTCFSVKACSNIAILRLFANRGGGFDVVSGGELFRVLKAGGDPAKVVYSGVGKTEAEIAYALQSGILMFNVESAAELTAIERVAEREKKTARVSLRVNPEVDPHTHPYIATGLKEAKFGIDVERSLELYVRAKGMERIEPVGVDCHIGSQLTQTAPFVEALVRLTELIGALRQHGLKISWLDLGGGLGITYRDERPPLPKEYAQEILAAVRSLDVSLILEPGRVIVGNAAVLLTRALYVKDTDEKRFLIIDAAMNDCIRPSLYGAYHEILPVREADPKSETSAVDVVGPICESGDFLAKNRPLPPIAAGELIATMSAGAYCASMASNYNSRPRAPEVLVSGKDAHLIRERESWDDLVARERVPDFLTSA
ncbi:MAG TPA: diaminopimelate decarboxylase [bacterium]|nr:diaminopimelate decarboxylase [bacterium]